MSWHLSKFALLYVIVIGLRFVEYGDEIVESRKRNQKLLPELPILYNVLYLHLPLSIAALGIVCDRMNFSVEQKIASSIITLLIIVAIAIGGCVCRGLLSLNPPEAQSIFDRDWLVGVIIPNTISFSSLAYAIFYS